MNGMDSCSPEKKTPFETLLKQFPILWDKFDFNYNDLILRQEAKLELLEKCNTHSKIHLTLHDLNRKLRTYKQKVYRDRGSQAPAQPQPLVLQLQPGPSSAYTPGGLGDEEDTGSSDSNFPFQMGLQDPLSKTPNQCRICGEFSKECIDMTNKDTPYLERNRIQITLNDMSVDLDLNTDALPKTVCPLCDVKLNVVFDFVKLVKSAQDALVVRVDDDMRQFPDMRETETLINKTECDSPTPDDNETKDGIFDIVTVGKTVFVKCNLAQKRKSDETHKKKAKVTKKVDKNKESSELVIDIKEEAIEMDDGHEAERLGIGDTGPDVKPSQLELVTQALHNEMPSNETFRETFTSDRRK